MHHAIAGVGGIFQSGNHAEHPPLLGKLQPCLEADDVVQRTGLVVLAELHHGKGLAPGAGIAEPHRLHGAEGQHHPAPAGHGFHRHAALEHPGFLKAVHLGGLRRKQRVHEGVVFLLGHGAVEVIVSPVVARLAEDSVHVQGFKGDDGGRRVIEIERSQPRQSGDGLGHGVGGQGPGGDDGGALRDFGHFAAFQGNERVLGQGFCDIAGETLPVHGQRAACRNPGQVGRAHDQGIEQAHFLLQQPHGVG